MSSLCLVHVYMDLALRHAAAYVVMVMARHTRARVAVIHYADWKLTKQDEAVTDAELNAALTRIRELLFAFERACIEHYQPCYNGYNGRSVGENTSE